MGHRIKTPRTRSKPWVAKIVGRCAVYKLDREFLVPMVDYWQQTRSGLRGVWCHFTLYEGFLYEAKELLSTRRSRRFFCKSQGGQVKEIEPEEVEQWLLRHHQSPPAP